MINKDEKKTIVLIGVIGLIAAAIMAFISLICSALCIAVSAASAYAFYRYNRKRISEIKRLNNYLSRVCSGDYSLDITSNAEGELSILKNNLYKVVVRLQTSNEALRNDKLYLADSLADISHQLKTPLTSMMMMSELMKDEKSEEKRKEFIEIIENQLDKMKWLITTILKISKLDAGTADFAENEVEISEVIDETLEQFSIILDIKNIEISRESSSFSFVGDKSWSAEAIGNIVKNCIEHVSDGGKLFFETNSTNIYNELIIRDNGCGIAEEDLPHIFERFYHGKNASSESIGIGLALAKEIFQKQRAGVEAESIVGEGALFRIRFYKSIV